ncbi:MAG: TadE/TadG family type IV pilus assembly protein [Pseudomonadota bacterium]
MDVKEVRSGRKAGSFLGSLIRDARANTLAMMTMALIPLAGMVGGGVDISRMYIVKTRLQHACDAGALAGRKAMGGGTWGYNSYYPRTSAEKFFDANYNSAAYGATSVTRSFSESAGKVSGTATATLPMTLMRIFGRTDETLTVACDAEMRLPNTDIMFVLDVTGSMASKAVNTDSQTKMEALKVAVKCFYEIVARLDTDAACTIGTPSGGTGNQVQIRFGFMPYSTNVNVGYLLPTNYFADSWKYQSREPMWSTSGTSTNWVQQGTPTSSSSQQQLTNTAYSYCNNSYASGYNTSSDAYSNNNNTKKTTAVTYTVVSWSSSSGGTCKYTQTTKVTTYTKQTVSTTTFNKWRYNQITFDISDLKSGTDWNSSLQLPVGSSGTNKTITWDGCIEERPTVRQSSYNPIPSGAYDLNIDLVPTSGNANSLFGPALQQLIYARNVTSSWSQAATAESQTTTDYYNSIPYYCPAEAKKLQSWTDADEFDNYVDGLVPTGNTYHDIGMLWGARFMSSTGMFASENAYTPQGGEIERHMIFMTDGDAVSAPCDYTAYGVAWWDKRTTTDVGSASNCTSERGALSDQVNARFEALCTAVKNKNITLWVISFGSGSNSDTEDRLEACASTSRYFVARDATTLQNTFKTIADQISQLRLTR